MKLMQFSIAAAFAALSITAPAAAATYLPTGPQLNVALSTVTGGGWTLCYSASFGTIFGSSASAATANCSGSRLLLAARATGSETLLTLAQAAKVDALFNTGTSDVTHFANGTEWYNGDNYSWGFAPGGESVSRSECDTNSGDGRICLHTLNFTGGYRINDIFGLNESSEYEKLVFSANAVPEPATWGLMIAGFGMVGTAARRRRTVTA